MEEEGERDFKNNNCRKKTNKKKVWESKKREKNLRGTQGLDLIKTVCIYL